MPKYYLTWVLLPTYFVSIPHSGHDGSSLLLASFAAADTAAASFRFSLTLLLLSIVECQSDQN